MDKTTRIFKTAAICAAILLATACKKDEKPAAILSLSPKADPIEFPADGSKPVTYKVTTNQSSWNAVSNQAWCKVTKTADSFTLTADENKTTTAPAEATVTVSAGEATPITIKATQKAAGPSLSIAPAPEGGVVDFPAAGETKTFTVTTNQPEWNVVSDKEWCKAEKSADGTGFTLTAARNGFPAAMEDAVVTVSAGDAPDVVLTAKQAGTPASVFGDDIEAAAEYGGGDGTAEKPYLITSAAELKKLVEETSANTAGKYYRLETDINVTAASWKPIGNNNINTMFQGNFDGNGHTVSGKLTLNTMIGGFFAYITGDAVVRNLTVDAEVVNTYSGNNSAIHTGAICGQMEDNARITGCTVKGSVSAPKGLENSGSIQIYTGGIAGKASGANQIIENCTNYASVDGGSGKSTNNLVEISTGGITGEAYGLVSGCVNGGTVTGGSFTSGDNTKRVYVVTEGVAGYLRNNGGVLHQCVNSGDVTGGQGTAIRTGGIVGNSEGKTYSCNTNTGTVDGQPASDGNRVGSGSVTTCPDGH